jgi:putative DNA modification/repair radical SAM protein
VNVEQKLAILADAAKYDASCASSGSQRKNPGGLGNTNRIGICHSYTPDGRCVSLLKILLTNFCIFDCAYCINRLSSDVPRAKFTIDDVVWLTLEFYRRNYMEGLFLSSGVYGSPDETMEEMGEIARRLRQEHRFGGYIHLKAVAGCSRELIEKAGRWADRLSANIELPTQQDLNALAPAKSIRTVHQAMGDIQEKIRGSLDDRGRSTRKDGPAPPKFAPAGQSTQLIVGATSSPDKEILKTASSLYGRFNLRRVYYTAFSPIPSRDARLPLSAPPLVREHRLYQADWLMRYYGFEASELVSDKFPNLDPELSPKLSWALRNRAFFPVDVNRASKRALLRVPGIGVRNAERMLEVRRHHKLRYEDLLKLRVNVSQARFFVTTADDNPHVRKLEGDGLAHVFRPPPKQLAMFGDPTGVASGNL